jgi:hypothetical protein
MIYSVFVPERGEYEYWETSEQRPLNADLPIPDLPPVVGGIGVPSIEAARALPAGARRVGAGWLPRGMIARRAGAFGALLGQSDMVAFGLLFAAALAAGWWLHKRPQGARR